MSAFALKKLANLKKGDCKMGIMFKNSRNNQLAGGREAAYMTLSGKVVLGLRSAAKAHGVEWHHAAGHSKGREVISFFPADPDQEAAVDRLAVLVLESNAKEKAEKQVLKAEGLPTSKAALWRYLEENGNEDKGFGGTAYKIGKFGKFVPSFGEPDGYYFYNSKEIAKIARDKL